MSTSRRLADDALLQHPARLHQHRQEQPVGDLLGGDLRWSPCGTSPGSAANAGSSAALAALGVAVEARARSSVPAGPPSTSRRGSRVGTARSAKAVVDHLAGVQRRVQADEVVAA